jgi:urea transport system permease protein
MEKHMDAWIIQGFNGVSLASILLLISLGLAFSFGLMGVINMAHGEFIMIGAYTTYVFETIIFAKYFDASPEMMDWGFWFILSIPMAFLVAGLVGVILEVTLIRKLYGRPLDTLLATWGVAMIMQQTARTIFGAPNVNVGRPIWLTNGVAWLWTDPANEEAMNALKPYWEVITGVRLPYTRLFILALVAFIVLLLFIYLRRTAAGRRLRATMQNREMASALGVRSRRVDALTFGIGGGLAGIAGSVLTLIGPVGPTLGTAYLVDAFLVVVLGGVGKLRGAILAALIIGLFNTVTAKWLISADVEAAATVAKVLVLLMVIAFLQWKPQGLVTVKAR